MLVDNSDDILGQVLISLRLVLFLKLVIADFVFVLKILLIPM